MSKSNIGRVVDYIAKQEEHHRRYSFEREFVLYLNKHGLGYDEKYVWG